jgi:hypothetical protein
MQQLEEENPLLYLRLLLLIHFNDLLHIKQILNLLLSFIFAHCFVFCFVPLRLQQHSTNQAQPGCQTADPKPSSIALSVRRASPDHIAICEARQIRRSCHRLSCVFVTFRKMAQTGQVSFRFRFSEMPMPFSHFPTILCPFSTF